MATIKLLFDLGNQEIMKKYPNHKLYDYTSVRTISDINNPEGKIKEMKRDLEIDKLHTQTMFSY